MTCRTVRLAVLTALCVGHLAHAAESAAQVDIPALPLASALREFAAQTGLQLAVETSLTAGKTSAAVKGTLSTQAALETLLKGSGLTFRFLDDRTIAVSTPQKAKQIERTLLEGYPLRLAQLSDSRGQSETRSQSDGAIGSDSGSKDNSNRPVLEEIVVTAQKKAERLQDVPVPVTVVDTQALADTHQVQIRDFYATIPGLNAMGGIYPGANTLLSIRGINSGGGGPTVGILIDDVPFGSTYGGYGGTDLPELDPGDLARIEVLRGPQGTLYGADSMGGLVKYVTTDPSTTGYSARIEAGINGVFRGADPGYDIRASANIPLSDTAAMRISGFHREDPGYIDNVEAEQKDVNKGRADGARLSLLWRPSGNISLKLSGLYQETRADGAPDVTAGLGDLQQFYLPGAGRYERLIEAGSAALNVNLDNLSITSLTGFNRTRTYHSLDYSTYFGSAGQHLYTPAVSGSFLYNQDNVERYTQELRFSGSIWTNLEWLVGAYYSHELNDNFQRANAVDPKTGEVFDQNLFVYYFSPNPLFEDYAGFAGLTYHLTDKLQVQFGGRETHYSFKLGQNTTTLAGTTTLTPAESASGSPFTYLVTPQYTISGDLMIYARLASGFRPGSPNTILPGVPSQVNPDKTENYEVGVKGDFFDHTLALDASAFYIAFKDIQILLLTPGGQYFSANGGNAKSDGVEISLSYKPTPGFTVSGWVDYDDAVLTQTFPGCSASASTCTVSSAYGLNGDRLPYSSRWSGNISAEQRFPVADQTTGFIGGVASFVGDRVGQFQATPVRQNYPAYTRMDLRAGLQYDSWTASIYANNLTDKRGLIAGGLDANPNTSFTFIQPRTVGLSVVRTFNEAK